ncbi:hypothetical protein F4553_000051 [Allocatelliglobosispora scoriae]|uniref:Alpha/beta hydrolase n=1 Tax=Allocatelliglobosispora scoriae TaxID=643052 RepID=A0A841BIS0_9ACTN|nr:hypothetical protein [Allocatelliglobosispora scoriae]MBB5866672.1 hypothetical protein [Allocatelliglobosispora scoriae]
MRAKGYATTLRIIANKVAEHQVGGEVRGCFWGEAVGAQLRGGGGSIPGYADSGGDDPSEADQLIALWSVLYVDPWYEFRLLRHRPPPGTVFLGQDPPSVVLRETVRHYRPSPDLQDALSAVGLLEHFAVALEALRESREFDQAAATAAADPLDHRRAVARALIAYAAVLAAGLGDPVIDGSVRDALTGRLTDELHGHGMSVGDFLLAPMKGVAKHLVTRRLTRQRGAITDSAAPFAGDVLRFLANGDEARAFLRRSINDIEGDVHLIGHSLGGVMCVDLLRREPVPEVKSLITVGSQAPLLYEIGALPGLEPPAGCRCIFRRLG